MPGQSLEINTSAALEDAENIVKIVEEVNSAMEELNNVVKMNMGSEGSGKAISTQWAGELLQEWTGIFTRDVPVVQNEMLQSAENLHAAVEGAQAYSN